MVEQIHEEIFYNLIDNNGANSLSMKILLPIGTTFKYPLRQSVYQVDEYRYDDQTQEMIVDCSLLDEQKYDITEEINAGRFNQARAVTETSSNF